MQTNVYGSFEEVEPRKMPKQASKFESRPFPMVPEVSLIIDKSAQQKTIDHSMSNSPRPDLKLSTLHDTTSRESESYASWKARHVNSHMITKTSSNLDYHSSTHISSPKEIHTSRMQQPSNCCNTKNCNCKNQLLDINHSKSYRNSRQESSNRSRGSRSPIENSHKYNLHQETHNTRNEYHSNKRYDDRSNHYHREESLSPKNSRSDHLVLYEHNHRPKIQRSSSYSHGDAYNRKKTSADYDHQLKYSRSLQPYYHNLERSHHAGCCNSNHNNSSTESETMKNLLEVITNQNDQIKKLQKQVEKFMELHEQFLKERNQCTCQSNGILYQNRQMYDAHSRTNNLPLAPNNIIKDNDKYFSDLKLPDEKSKSTILEQKVSIGVMTSFELKVQNNPSLIPDNETKQNQYQDKIVSNLGTSNIIKGLVNETGDMIRKKKSNFVPIALENISEGSESYISSHRQSRTCSDSTRQSLEIVETVESMNRNFNRMNIDQRENFNHNVDTRQYSNPSNERNENLDNFNSGMNEQVRNRNNDFQELMSYKYEFTNENRPPTPSNNEREKKSDDSRSDEPLSSNITKMKNIRCDNVADDCLSLSSSDLDVEDPSPPSPEPSIHVDMQEYSSESGSLPPQQAAKVGWTLYNNVLDQVNQILQNTSSRDNAEQVSNDEKRNNRRREYDNNYLMDTVKVATMEQLTKLGISFSENVDQREPPNNKKVLFDAASYARQGTETQIAGATASYETNTSMHMKALAMKYLNNDQLADTALQKQSYDEQNQIPSSIQNTNMSFATMRYLQRYQLLPSTNNNSKPEAINENYRGPRPVINERIPIKAQERKDSSPHRYASVTGISKVSYPSKILDISTLKQQPKLL